MGRILVVDDHDSLRKGLVRAGDVVLMMAGHSHTRGATNMLRVHTIA